MSNPLLDETAVMATMDTLDALLPEDLYFAVIVFSGDRSQIVSNVPDTPQYMPSVLRKLADIIDDRQGEKLYVGGKPT